MPLMMELPRYCAEGAPAGVKLAAEEDNFCGGGVAGVVEGWLPKERSKSGLTSRFRVLLMLLLLLLLLPPLLLGRFGVEGCGSDGEDGEDGG
jgi:hypothetical protein